MARAPYRRGPDERNLSAAERATLLWPNNINLEDMATAFNMDLSREVATASDEFEYILRIPAYGVDATLGDRGEKPPLLFIYSKSRDGSTDVVLYSTFELEPKKDSGRGTS